MISPNEPQPTPDWAPTPHHCDLIDAIATRAAQRRTGIVYALVAMAALDNEDPPNIVRGTE